MSRTEQRQDQRAEQLYQFLVDEEDARVCKDIPDNACQVVPGNFLLQLLAQLLTKLADALASAKVVLPWLLSSSGVPPFFSGLLVPIRESGSLIPQLAISSVIRRYPLRKWFLALGAILQALGLLALAAVAANMTGVAAGWAIVGLLAVVSLSRGLTSVASKDVVGKTVPKSRRGTLNGYAASISGGVALLLGAALVLGWLQAVEQRAIFLLLAAAALLLSGLVYSLLREYSGALEGGANAVTEAISSLRVLVDDKHFRRFISTRALMMCSGLSAPFLVILAQQCCQQSGFSLLGWLVLVSGVASLVSGIVWGRLADRSSRQVMIVTSVGVTLVCLVSAWFSWRDNIALWWILALYFALAVIHEGVRVGRKTYVLDMAGGEKRSDYVAVGNSLIGILLLVVGLLTAALANASLTWALVSFAAMALLASLLALTLPEV